MAREHNEIFKEMAKAGRRTYFLDVKKAANGSMYLVIHEKVKSEEGWSGHRVMIFEDIIFSFDEHLKKAIRFMMDKTTAKPAKKQ